jgi:hypothetical protein
MQQQSDNCLHDQRPEAKTRHRKLAIRSQVKQRRGAHMPTVVAKQTKFILIMNLICTLLQLPTASARSLARDRRRHLGIGESCLRAVHVIATMARVKFRIKKWMLFES